MHKCTICVSYFSRRHDPPISFTRLRQLQPSLLSVQRCSAWSTERLPERLLHNIGCLLSYVCYLLCCILELQNMSANSRYSGWSVLPSALYGTQTPCFTVPEVPLVAPTSLQARAASLVPRAASTSVITSQLFSQRYPLAEQNTSLSTGAIVGVAVGSTVGFFLLVLFLVFFIRRYRAIRKKQLEDTSTQFSGTRFIGPDPFDRRVSVISQAPGGYYPQGEPSPNELPDSASHPPVAEREIWFPQAQAPISPMVNQHGGGQGQLPVYAAPNELPGDEHILAHHPAFGVMPNATPSSQHPIQDDRPASKGNTGVP